MTSLYSVYAWRQNSVHAYARRRQQCITRRNSVPSKISQVTWVQVKSFKKSETGNSTSHFGSKKRPIDLPSYIDCFNGPSLAHIPKRCKSGLWNSLQVTWLERWDRKRAQEFGPSSPTKHGKPSTIPLKCCCDKLWKTGPEDVILAYKDIQHCWLEVLQFEWLWMNENPAIGSQWLPISLKKCKQFRCCDGIEQLLWRHDDRLF